MNCPQCNALTKVNTTRQVIDREGGTLRRRVCANCDNRFYTIQDPQRVVPNSFVQWREGEPVIDRDGLARLEGRK
jgi:transcriptional regulator NrdR family protein